LLTIYKIVPIFSADFCVIHGEKVLNIWNPDLISRLIGHSSPVIGEKMTIISEILLFYLLTNAIFIDFSMIK